MVRDLLFEFLGVFEVFVTDAGGAEQQFLNLARPPSHRAQGQDKPQGETPRSDHRPCLRQIGARGPLDRFWSKMQSFWIFRHMAVGRPSIFAKGSPGA